MSSSNLLNIGSQALTASTVALNVVGQNIANVDTEGYSRQSTTLVSREYQNGVTATDISRITDQFLQSQIYSQTSSYYSLSSYEELASQLDNLLAADTTSISDSMDTWFESLQTAIDDPSNLANRQLLLSETDALIQSFSSLDTQLESQNAAVNTEISDAAAAINSLSANLAAVNDSIRLANATDSTSNELLDQRDQILNDLAGYINFTSDIQSDGQVNIYIGQGEPLVVGQTSYTLSTAANPDDPQELNLYLTIGSQQSDLTSQISGGVLGGVIEYRETVLGDARDQLGLLSLTFTDNMNTLQTLGLDLNGEFGSEMFADINSADAVSNRLVSNSENAASALESEVYLVDLSAVQATEYTLEFDSRSQVTLERADGASWSYDEVDSEASISDVDEDGEFYLDSASGELVIQQDGMLIKLEISTTRSPVGDSYTIQPTRYGVDNMELLINDGSELAFAEPVSITEDASNQGSAEITATVSSSEFRGKLASYINSQDASAGATDASVMPLQLSFSDDGSGGLLYSISDADGNAIATDLEYQAGEPLLSVDTDLDGDGSADNLDLGISLEISGTPRAGDSYTLAFNENGVSDNRNALAMAELQYTQSVEGASYQDYYAVLVQEVGSLTSVAQINSEAAKSLLDTNTATLSSISGVNLDEEAADLVKYQQAYAAASQLISTWQEMFDTLLASVNS